MESAGPRCPSTGAGAPSRTRLRADAAGDGTEPVGARQGLRGDLDFRGTLGVDKTAPVGFQTIRLIFELDSTCSDEELDTLMRLTERYCVVYQTLIGGVDITVERQRVAA